MTTGEKRRKSIFDKYSDNLTFLSANKIINLGQEFDKVYICPICLEQFSEHSLDQTTENPLTLEDVPPKSLGGKADILTCKKCNNTCGYELDKHLYERMLELDAHEFLPNVKFSAKFDINSTIVQGTIEIDRDGNMEAIHMDKNNHPVRLKDYIGSAKSNVIINMAIDKKNVNPINLQLALLKTGYLFMFEKFGYSLILDHTYDRIRKQLLKPFEISYPLDFWFKAPWPKEIYGVPFIMEKGLESICPIFPLTTKSSERVFVTIIPLTSKPIEEIISELKNKFKEQERFPVAFDPMNSGIDYLTNLEAITKMLNWINNLKKN